MKTPTKPRQSKEQVIAALEEQTTGLLEHMYEDRDWIWYCGPALTGKANAAIRNVLKNLGFRFSPKGHLMPDGETIGTWGHSCQRPMFPKRRRHPTTRDHETEVEDHAQTGLAALGL